MNDDQQAIITNAVRDILQILANDLDSDVLEKTPARVARVLIDLTKGYGENADAIINNAYYPAESNHMVIVRNIRYASICEHHLMPFVGEAYVAYIPKAKVIGLSKIPRIVNMYARRFQIQERMTAQIAELLYEKLSAQGVAVITTGLHLCTLIRGVRSCSANMVSATFLGKFCENSGLRGEFLDLISVPIFARSDGLAERLRDIGR